MDQYLKNLLEQVLQSGTIEDQQAANQINQIFRNLWWGLFTCYDVGGLSCTNNDLEQFLRRIKMGQRRISGHKNVQDFILRYGNFVAFVDYAEGEEELRNRLAQVSQIDFLKERSTLNMIIVKEQKSHRFRFHRLFFKVSQTINLTFVVQVRQTTAIVIFLTGRRARKGNEQKVVV